MLRNRKQYRKGNIKNKTKAWLKMLPLILKGAVWKTEGL